jgi:hypothetical protein
MLESHSKSSMSNKLLEVLILLRVALCPATYGVQIHTHCLKPNVRTESTPQRFHTVDLLYTFLIASSRAAPYTL